MKDIIRQIKKHWKVLTALAVVLTVSVIGMTILFANDVVLTMQTIDGSGVETDKTTWKMSDAAPSLKAAVSATSSDSPIASEAYTWSSSEPEVMAVSAVAGTDDKEVQLVFKGAGKTTIKCRSIVTFEDGTQADKTVTRDFFILLEPGSDTFQVKEVDDTVQLITNYSQSSDANKLTWSSSNSDIAQIVEVNGSRNGYVGGVKIVGSGVAEITARTNDGQSVKFTILVKSKFNNTAMIEVKPDEYVSIYEKGEANCPDPTLLIWG